MTIKLFNTLTNKKEEFKTIEENKVKMYLCGPTVYNYIHIGNARPAIVFDTIRKYLEYKGYEVNFVSNFTDVDDKIINAALELKEDVKELTERFIKAYLEDINDLGCQKATHNPKVSDHIEDIVDFIKVLIEKDYAYESSGDVYFRAKKFSSYGKLSNQNIKELISGARVEISEIKEDAVDFALWKKSKENEVSWESPWGNGRPGWHIECSVMARKHLSDTIDIHAGGIDLTFPHHENEIAQSEAHNDKTFANYWLHNGHINIDDKKMSKSLGNFLLVNELKKQIDPKVLRYFILSTHYRQPINYGTLLIEEASNSYNKIKNSYNNLNFSIKNNLYSDSVDINYKSDLIKEIANVKKTFEKNMDDDFNTANAITSLHELVNINNNYLLGENVNPSLSNLILKTFNEFIKVLGIEFEANDYILDEEIDKLISEREKAKENKDFDKADRIRNDLLKQGIVLEDTRQGTRWKKINN